MNDERTQDRSTPTSRLRGLLCAAAVVFGGVAAAALPLASAQAQCTNTCQHASDNECDDGGPRSLNALCELGSDCDDCGPRDARSQAQPLRARAATSPEKCASPEPFTDGIAWIGRQFVGLEWQCELVGEGHEFSDRTVGRFRCTEEGDVVERFISVRSSDDVHLVEISGYSTEPITFYECR